LTKKSFEEIYKKVTKTTKGNRNEFKLRRSSKKLLDQAKKDKKICQKSFAESRKNRFRTKKDKKTMQSA